MTATAPVESGMSVEEFRRIAAAVEDEVGKLIVGQQEILREVLICLIAGGHALLEGVPGPGQDDAGAHPRRGAGPRVQPHPVHART